MKWFLDTNICIYLLNGSYPSVREMLLSKRPSEIRIPSITLAELFAGAEMSDDAETNRELIEQFASPFEIVPFDRDAAASYGKVRAFLRDKNLKVGPNDMAIASIVLSRGATLVTNNAKEFGRIDGLLTENWV
jgi:tRNA(fMet)-specific endonuclease VapC